MKDNFRKSTNDGDSRYVLKDLPNKQVEECPTILGPLHGLYIQTFELQLYSISSKILYVSFVLVLYVPDFLCQVVAFLFRFSAQPLAAFAH